MSSGSGTLTLRVVLFSSDAGKLGQYSQALRGMSVETARDESALSQCLRSAAADVVVVCEAELPGKCEQLERRPTIIWLAPDQADGAADVILSERASERELRECVELIGTRSALWHEMEDVARKVAEAFDRHQWRGSGMWRSPDELAEMAITDPLTGVFNRRHLDQVLEQEFDRHTSSGSPLSVLLLDLDRFKPVNDRLGHRVGDSVLRQVALRLNRATRGSDLVCRYGGDEFAVVAPGSDAHAARLLAERLKHSITDQPYVTEGHVSSIGCSLGVACAPEDHAGSAADLVHKADLAMLAAKRSGGNAVCRWSDQTR